MIHTAPAKSSQIRLVMENPRIPLHKVHLVDPSAPLHHKQTAAMAHQLEGTRSQKVLVGGSMDGQVAVEGAIRGTQPLVTWDL